MRAGNLRHKINIEALTTTTDAYGGDVTTWSATLANLPASYEPLNGKEFFAADRINSKTVARFRIRYVAGITSAMRVNYGGRLFNIDSPPIDPRGAGRELQLMVSEIL